MRGRTAGALFGWADYYALEVLSAVRALGPGRLPGLQVTWLLIEGIKGRSEAGHFAEMPRVVARNRPAFSSALAGMLAAC